MGEKKKNYILKVTIVGLTAELDEEGKKKLEEAVATFVKNFIINDVKITPYEYEYEGFNF